MGRGVKWTSDEKRVAAAAYRMTVLDPLHVAGGIEEKSDRFRSKLIQSMASLLTQYTWMKEIPPNRYHHRGVMTVINHMKDSIFPDCQKFKKAVRAVNDANLSSDFTLQQKTNIAVAIHLNVAEEVNPVFKDYDPLSWPNYKAWMELKDLPKFRCTFTPSKASAANASDEDSEDIEDDSRKGKSKDDKKSKSNDDSKKAAVDVDNDGGTIEVVKINSKRLAPEQELVEEVRKLRKVLEARDTAKQQEQYFTNIREVIAICGDDSSKQREVSLLKKHLIEETMKSIVERNNSFKNKASHV